MNPIETINFYKGRDVSPYLFHFVKGNSPLQVLEKILKENALKSVKYPYICYTESPLRVMNDILDYFQTYKDKLRCSPMFEKYGIGLNKKKMYEKYGARPVIYGTYEERKLFDISLQWRFERLDFCKWDFSWQREWRTNGNLFELPEDNEDVVIICKYEKEAERLKELYGHPCISFEYIDNNHASDYDVECYVGLQLMSDFEIECYKQESEDLLRQKSTGK